MAERRAKKSGAAKPWSKTKAEGRVLSPDELWAEKKAEAILADCHPWQRDAATDPARFYSLLVGRGGAKTTTFRVRALLKMMRKRRANLLYLATTRGQAEELNWFKLKDAVEAYGLTDDFEFTESKLRATCKRTGSIYTMSGAEDDRDIERDRGQPFDEVQVDEGGSHDPDRLDRLFYRIIAPRLGDRLGSFGIGGTPSPTLRGLFYDRTRPGACVETSDEEGNRISVPLHRPFADRHKPEFADWDGWSSHHWTLLDVVSLPDAERRFPALCNLWSEALKHKKRERWSDENPIWLREYLGRWAADDTAHVFHYRPHVDGLPWNQWDPLGEIKLAGAPMLLAAIAALPKELRDWRFVFAMDDGYKDPFACNGFAFSPRDPERRIFHVFAYERTQMYAKQKAQLLIGEALDHSKLGGLLGITGWPDGMIIDADDALIAELGNVYGIRIAKAERNPNYKFGAIELTNGDLVDGRIKIMKGTPLERQLGELQWKEDDFGKKKEDKAQANHSTDTLIYGRRLIAHLFEAGNVVQEEQAKQPAYADPQGLELEELGAADDNVSGLLAAAEYADDGWG